MRVPNPRYVGDMAVGPPDSMGYRNTKT